MKRGGLIPTPQSYTVFFAALNPRMFRGAFRDKVYTIFKQWQEFAIRVRQKGTREYELAQAQPEEYTLSAIPTNAFLTMMYRSGTYEAEPIAKAIEVLLDMDTFAPTKETFAILFMTLRAILDNPGYGRSIPIAQNMALFQRGWDLMWKRVTREESVVDGHSLSCALTLLRDIHRLEPRIISQNQRLNYLQQVEWLLDLEDPNELVPDIRKKATGRIRKKDTSVLVDAFSLAAAFEGKYSRHVLKWFERVRKDHHELLESRLCAIYIKASPQNAFGESLSFASQIAFLDADC